MEEQFVSRPLLLTGAKNVRDLGGYPTGNGATAQGVFLRGDGLSALTEEDISALAQYGVRRVVDLRSGMELQRQPDPFGNVPEIAYDSVPMLDQMNSSGFQGQLPASLSELYCALLDGDAASIGRVMKLLAEEEGAVLFHCTAGKDRTGVIAMLLLDLAGVSEEDIVADYGVTETYMAAKFEAQRAAAAAAGFDLPDFLFRSQPEEMRRTLEHLHTAWGSAEAYLTGPAGCSSELIARLREKLTAN